MTPSKPKPLSEAAITLPWPHKGLSPNARLHWAAKAKLVKAAREQAGWITLASMGLSIDRSASGATIGSNLWGWAAARLDVVFCPPDKRRRDKDNLIASLKGATDGISDALGIDDSKFISTYRMGEVVKGGAVRITIGEAS